MEWPEFTLKNLPGVLGFPHASDEATMGLSGRGAAADPPQPPSVSGSRIAQWSRACGRCLEKDAFAAQLAGGQVDTEIASIFRETPEFGRSIAERLADFHDIDSTGRLILIGAGGEAVVFYDTENQRVLKLLGLAGKAGFGWHVKQPAVGGAFSIRSGGLAESLERFWLAEREFPTGLDLEAVGTDADFIVLSQPFILGDHPAADALEGRMRDHGWHKVELRSELNMLTTQSWQKGDCLATDVRPENAILAEADGQIYPFDFIMARKP